MHPLTDRLSNHLIDDDGYVLLYFTAPWCRLCRMIEPVLQRLVAEWGDALDVVSVNADENLPLVCGYRIRSLPTLLLMHEGREVVRLSHFSSIEDAISRFETLLLTHQEQIVS